MSCAQREQPQFRKESIGPAIMVQAASAAAPTLPTAQDRTQPHAYPADPPLACTPGNACCRLTALYTLSIKLNHCLPLTPRSRAVNIRSVQTSGSTQLHRARMSLACLVSADTAASLSSVLLSIPSSTSLRPLAPRPLRRFFATTDAVTPLSGLFPNRGLPDSCTWPSCHSVSNHLCRPSAAFSRYPSARWTSSSQRSGLRLRLAGSPQTPAESSLSSYGLAVHSL